MSKLKKGLLIQGYQLEEQIGEGGSGVVWRGKNMTNSKLVAIKFLKENANKKQENRFEQEIEFLKNNVDQRYVLHYINSGTFNNRRYHITEYCDNTYRMIINQETDDEVLFEYILQLTECLKFLHENEIYHRDLKPENIFIKNKMIKLGDFGIIHNPMNSLTSLSDRLANFKYAAPEQRVANNDSIDSKADIYALGLIINETFTKQVPIGEQFTLVKEKYPHLYGLDKLVSKMTNNEPSKRPSTIKIQFVLEHIKNTIEEYYAVAEEIDNSNSKTEILKEVSQDLMFADYLFETIDVKSLKKYDLNFHCRNSYSVSKYLYNFLACDLIFEVCKNKFNYEGNVHLNNQYQTLDIASNEKHRKLHESLIGIFDGYKFYDSHQFNLLKNRSLKYFDSCKDYHCEEILEAVERRIETLKSNVIDAPILWILTFIKEYRPYVGTELVEKFSLNLIFKGRKDLTHNPDLMPDYSNKNIKNTLKMIKSRYNADIESNYLGLNESTHEIMLKNSAFADFEHDCIKYAKTINDPILEADINYAFSKKMEGQKMSMVKLDGVDINQIGKCLYENK